VLSQRRAAPDPAFYIGEGKARELAATARDYEAGLAIFNDELSASQVRNLERLTGLKIMDRTTLILDIFASRARSREGKLQVELARLQYSLLHLIGAGQQLSRLGGGIGTRGPGETQLESDRRVIRRRIGELKNEIKAIRRHRSLHRQRRQRNKIPLISLVGYTNAGKSTLLNALTGAELYTADQLFATLDPTVRRAVLPGGRAVLLADTVGFIEKLPKTLETAFRATLEEINAADLLLHVVDLSRPHCLRQMDAVREQLQRIEPHYYLRELVAFNKIDCCNDSNFLNALQRQHPGALFISARSGAGLETLRNAIASRLEEGLERIKVYLPYSQTALIEQMQRFGKVLRVDYQPAYQAVDALVEPAMAARLIPYLEKPESGEQSDLENKNLERERDCDYA